MVGIRSAAKSSATLHAQVVFAQKFELFVRGPPESSPRRSLGPLHATHCRSDGGPRASTSAVVWDASLDVRGAVVYATYVVVLVFLPVMGLSGLQGRLFAPLALA